MESSIQPVTPPATPTTVDISDSHSKTYFLDFIVFQVENEYFRVPSIQFTRAQCFNTMSYDVVQDNKLNCDVIQLNGMKTDEFDALLTVLYPLPFFGQKTNLSEEGWIAVLRISSEWGMMDIRRAALEALMKPEISPLSQISVGRTFYAPCLTETGTLQPLMRNDSVTFSDAAILGLEASFHVLAARDHCYAQYQTWYHTRFGGNVTSAALTSSQIEASAISKSIARESQDVFEPQQTEVKNDVALLCLARECKVASWVEAAYEKLVKRTNFLSLEEAKTLGLRDTVGIGRAREATFLALKEATIAKGKKCPIVVDYKEAMRAAFRGP